MKQQLLFSLIASLICITPVTAQAQDAAKVLNLFQSILGGAQPATPAPAAPAGGLAGALLGTALAPAAAPQGNRGSDLFQLLSQSLDQIDEPREIQIGQQLSAMLLGSKPLLPDMVMQRYVNNWAAGSAYSQRDPICLGHLPCLTTLASTPLPHRVSIFL